MRRYSMACMCLLAACLWLIACSRDPESSRKNESESKPASPQVDVNVTVNLDKSGPTQPAGVDNLGQMQNAEMEVEYPEPPAKDSSEADRLIHYFCKCWKDEDYEKMYGALDKSARQSISFSKFLKRFESDSESTGGLQDENLLQKVSDSGSEVVWKVELRFRNKNVKPRSANTTAKKTANGYRIMESGLIPIDLDDL